MLKACKAYHKDASPTNSYSWWKFRYLKPAFSEETVKKIKDNFSYIKSDVRSTENGEW